MSCTFGRRGELPGVRPCRAFSIASLVGSWLLCCGLAVAHDPPPVAIEADLTAENLKTHISIKEELYRRWIEHDPTLIDTLEEVELSEIYDRIQRFVSENAAVHIDRVEVNPILDYVEYQPGFAENDFLNYVAFDVVYGVKGIPRQISFQWQRYDADDEWFIEQVSAVIGYEGDFHEMLFTEAEPQVIWHAPRDATPRPRRIYVPPPRAELVLPLVSLGIFAGTLLLCAAFAWTRTPRAIGWPVALALCGLAVGLSDLSPRSIHPPWVPKVKLPVEEEARYLFESLHRNIYRAFDYDSESEIYDALAQSIDDQLLDEVYNEVYQSLVLEQEGGAMCKVKGVKVLDSEVLYPEERKDTFEVEAQWRVTGTVTHWGHSHWRTNEYRALYSLRGDGENWRITDVEIRDQQRLTTQGATSF